jgi:hypothetical protein
MIIPVVTGAIGVVTKGLKKNLKAMPGKYSIGSVQKTATLRTSHLIRKVLQSETSYLCGEDHCWFKRTKSVERQVTRKRTDDDDHHHHHQNHSENT